MQVVRSPPNSSDSLYP